MVNKAFIFVYYKQGLKTIMKTDLSNYVSNKVFFKINQNGLLYLITFFSKNLHLTKCNYKIYNKKFFIIICYFK